MRPVTWAVSTPRPSACRARARARPRAARPAAPTVADAILDRLVHNAHKLVMKGESMRKVANRPQQIDQS